MKILRLLIILVGCTSLTYAQKIERWWVEGRLMNCVGEIPQNCMKIRGMHGDNDSLYFYGAIEGFEFQEGVDQLIEVEVIEKNKPFPQDVSSFQYSLVRVLEKHHEQKSPYYKNFIIHDSRDVNLIGVEFEVRAVEQLLVARSCNTMSIPYKRIGKKKLQLEESAISMRMCEDAINAQERQLRNLFTKGEICLYSKREGVRLKGTNGVKAKALSSLNPDVALLKYLERFSWRLIWMEGKQIVDFSPVINLSLDHSMVVGNSGCNSFSSTVVFQKEVVVFSAVKQTLMACESSENQFLGLISGQTLRWDIADQVLNLYKNNELIMMFSKIDKQEF